MDFKNITAEEFLFKAVSYITAMKKQEFIDYAAARCIDKMEVAVADENLNLPMPPYYKSNTLRKNRYLMGAFVKLYLQQEFEPVENDLWLMAQDDFDKWAGGHIFNQIDRLKKNGGEIRDKAFDVLEDYSNLKRQFNAEIDTLLAVMNDPCQRIMAMITMQTTPEVFQNGITELESLKSQIQKVTGKKGG